MENISLYPNLIYPGNLIGRYFRFSRCAGKFDLFPVNSRRCCANNENIGSLEHKTRHGNGMNVVYVAPRR